MAAEEVSIAAASAPVDTDILKDSDFRQAPKGMGSRRVIGVALTGSAAAGDTVAELKNGQTLIARLRSRATGFATRDHVLPLDYVLPAGDELACKITDAPATNAINLLVLFGD